jgi:hypothetical protein
MHTRGNVRFCEDTVAAPACADSEQDFDASFGFLKCDSSYLMRLQADQHSLHQPLVVEYQASTQHGDLAVQFVDDVLEIVLFAKSPGKFLETVKFLHSGSLVKSIHVKANILPLTMGTPALKDNVVCVSKSSKDSEASDWQGF